MKREQTNDCDVFTTMRPVRLAVSRFIMATIFMSAVVAASAMLIDDEDWAFNQILTLLFAFTVSFVVVGLGLAMPNRPTFRWIIGLGVPTLVGGILLLRPPDPLLGDYMPKKLCYGILFVVSAWVLFASILAGRGWWSYFQWQHSTTGPCNSIGSSQ